MVRIQNLFKGDLTALRDHITSYTYSDEQTKAAMTQLYKEYKYVACPHTAIAWLASQAYLGEHPGHYASIFLSTAHPCKFPDAIDPEAFSQVVLPEGAIQLKDKEKQATSLAVDYEAFKQYLINHN